MPGKSKVTFDLVPVDNFGGHSKVQFGVGEEITLTFTETPAADPPTVVEATVKSGNATIKAAKKAGTFDIKCGNKPGAVVLEFKNKADKSVVGTKRLEVVAPSGLKAKVHQKLDGGKDGYGFVAQLWFEPQDVSFKWVEKKEGAAPWEGKGCFQKAEIKDISGGKMGGDEYAVIHPVNGTWIPCAGGKKKNAVGYDEITSAPPSAWAPGGTFEWKIPQFYRVTGMPGDTVFMIGVHKEVIDANGLLKVGKFGVGNAIQLPPSA